MENFNDLKIISINENTISLIKFLLFWVIGKTLLKQMMAQLNEANVHHFT